MKNLELFSPGALQPFVRCLSRRGIDAGRFLEKHFIPPETVALGTGKILKRPVYLFFKDVARRERIETLGFLDGDPYPISELGSIGSAVLRSVTLKDAIDTFSGLLSTVAEGNTIWLEKGPQTSWLCCFTDSLERTDSIPDHTSVLALREVVRLAAGEDWQPEQMRFFTQPEPALGTLSDLTGCELTHLQDYTAIALPTGLLHLPLLDRVDHTPRQNGFAADTPPETTVDKLDVVLETLHQNHHLPTVDEIAEMLDMSRATLFRALVSEGTNYRQTIERVRFRAATRLLMDSSLSVKEIAYELGYSSPGNFSRAFQRMSGMTPSLFRRKIT